MQDADFRYSSLIDPGIYYRNGSSIVFVDLAPAPTDPNFDRFGSLSLTHVIIEEAGEAVHKARSAITSRGSDRQRPPGGAIWLAPAYN